MCTYPASGLTYRYHTVPGAYRPHLYDATHYRPNEAKVTLCGLTVPPDRAGESYVGADPVNDRALCPHCRRQLGEPARPWP